MAAAPEPLEIACPRCGESRSVRFFGPCDECRAELRRRFDAAGRAVEVDRYEPSMNVTPNFVATKD